MGLRHFTWPFTLSRVSRIWACSFKNLTADWVWWFTTLIPASLGIRPARGTIVRPCLGKKKFWQLRVCLIQFQEGRREAQKATRADFVTDPEVCYGRHPVHTSAV